MTVYTNIPAVTQNFSDKAKPNDLELEILRQEHSRFRAFLGHGMSSETAWAFRVPCLTIRSENRPGNVVHWWRLPSVIKLKKKTEKKF